MEGRVSGGPSVSIAPSFGLSVSSVVGTVIVVDSELTDADPAPVVEDAGDVESLELSSLGESCLFSTFSGPSPSSSALGLFSRSKTSYKLL